MANKRGKIGRPKLVEEYHPEILQPNIVEQPKQPESQPIIEKIPDVNSDEWFRDYIATQTKEVQQEFQGIESINQVTIPMDDGKTEVIRYDGKAKKAKKGEGFSFWKKRKLGSNPTSTFMLTFMYGNGTLKHLVLEGKGNVFTLNKRKYHLAKEKSWYDVNNHQNRLFYYEDYPEPLNRSVFIDGDKRFLSITPDNLQDVMGMEYVKVLSQSQQLSKWLKIAVFLMIANLGLTLINTLIFVLQSGILKGVLKH